MVKLTNECGTCYVPYKKSVTKEECGGLKDGTIFVQKDCKKHQVTPAKLTVSEAMAYASSAGMPVTRPTMIHWCVAERIGKQIGGKWGRWMVDAAKLRKMFKED